MVVIADEVLWEGKSSEVVDGNGGVWENNDICTYRVEDLLRTS